jgi:hypothetical protein
MENSAKSRIIFSLHQGRDLQNEILSLRIPSLSKGKSDPDQVVFLIWLISL